MMKKLFALVLALCTILSALPALAEGVEPNTMVAKIDGEMVNLYLNYTSSSHTAVFCAYDENGKTTHSIRLQILKSTKKGTYEGFCNENIYGMWLNTDYKRDAMGDTISSVQYMGADYSGVKKIVGGSQADLTRWKNNQGDIVLRLTTATGYRFAGEFSAVLHDTMRDTLIPVQGKFDFTHGEKYEAPEGRDRVDHGLSLDDIDF